MEVIDRFYGKKPSINNHSFLDYPSQCDCLTIFFSGCEHNCKNCQNKELQLVGKVYDEMEYDDFVASLKEVASRVRTNKIVLQGGDPLHRQNRSFTKRLIHDLHKEYDFCVYTGYEFKSIKKYVSESLYVKCGKFREDLFILSEKTDDYFQLASTNQEIYKNNKLISNRGRIYFD